MTYEGAEKCVSTDAEQYIDIIFPKKSTRVISVSSLSEYDYVEAGQDYLKRSSHRRCTTNMTRRFSSRNPLWTKTLCGQCDA